MLLAHNPYLPFLARNLVSFFVLLVIWLLYNTVPLLHLQYTEPKAELVLFLRQLKVGSTSIMEIAHLCSVGEICASGNRYEYLGAQLCRGSVWKAECSGGSASSAVDGNLSVGTRIIHFDQFEYLQQLRYVTRPAFISVHAPFLESLYALQPVKFIAMLRDPVARSASLYNYIMERFVCSTEPKYGANSWRGIVLSKYSSRQCNEGVTNLSAAAQYFIDPQRYRATASPVPLVLETAFRNYYIRDYGTVSLSDRRQSVHLATRRLRSFSWVGILEAWPVSICLLTQELPNVFSTLRLDLARTLSANTARHSSSGNGYAYIRITTDGSYALRHILRDDYTIYEAETERLRTRLQSHTRCIN